MVDMKSAQYSFQILHPGANWKFSWFMYSPDPFLSCGTVNKFMFYLHPFHDIQYIYMKSTNNLFILQSTNLSKVQILHKAY